MKRFLPCAAAAVLAGCQGLPPQSEPPPSDPTSAKAPAAPWSPPLALATAPSLLAAPEQTEPKAQRDDREEMDMPGMKSKPSKEEGKPMKDMKGMPGMKPQSSSPAAGGAQ